VIAERFKRYGQLVNYRRVLDIGGATDFFAAVTPAGPDPVASDARTRALMKALAARHGA